jgi:hypothetical protein
MRILFSVILISQLMPAVPVDDRTWSGQQNGGARRLQSSRLSSSHVFVFFLDGGDGQRDHLHVPLGSHVDGEQARAAAAVPAKSSALRSSWSL